MTPSRNTRSYTLRSVPSSPGRSFFNPSLTRIYPRDPWHSGTLGKSSIVATSGNIWRHFMLKTTGWSICGWKMTAYMFLTLIWVWRFVHYSRKGYIIIIYSRLVTCSLNSPAHLIQQVCPHRMHFKMFAKTCNKNDCRIQISSHPGCPDHMSGILKMVLL